MKSNILIIAFALIMFGCQSNDIEITDQTNDQKTTMDNSNGAGVAQGVIRVKFSPEVGDNMEIAATRVRSTGSEDINRYLNEIGATGIERVFPYAGKYEERSRKEGLHLWYDIVFDKDKPVTRAASSAANIPGIDIVEEVMQPELAPFSVEFVDLSAATRATTYPFGDPGLPLQWHYNNDGRLQRSEVGADINLFAAWQRETGRRNVIVSIVDGGIDANHEDLRDNMYVNSAEYNGVTGVDDDNNGYIDDIYGYNFVYNRGRVTADSHGTHVAGTVAARNNNNKGVCGVAGGNGRTGTGVRVMSCQIFSGTRGGNSAAAIKYGADNGAVISQNSWGYTYPGPSRLPASEKAAIDYFIRYAGCDEYGRQLPTSPMKGGVVIFAAGNDGREYRSLPASYAPVVSVSSMAPNFKKAFYTNRGTWVSIMAPGGDENFTRQGQVLSTMPGNRYGYMQGTSMACPHVSGIAALIVSRFGGAGFTNTQLKTRLLRSVKSLDIDEQNPGYEGVLGAGYIDAYRALLAQ